MILLDTSALAKLLVDEAESAALREALPDLARGEVLAISAVAVTELRRLAIRLDIAADRTVPIVRPFEVLRLTDGILQVAGGLPHRQLGTLDAIHIATALVMEATVIVTYDRRQAGAAADEGLRVRAPGRD